MDPTTLDRLVHVALLAWGAGRPMDVDLNDLTSWINATATKANEAVGTTEVANACGRLTQSERLRVRVRTIVAVVEVEGARE